jgi:hypothetical protein
MLLSCESATLFRVVPPGRPAPVRPHPSARASQPKADRCARAREKQVILLFLELHMMEGLWIVQYEGTAGGDGGVIVFVRGQALGGDNAFVYSGTYQSDATRISARVLVRNFNPAIGNVLGIKGDFELIVQGTIQCDTIRGSASLINQEGPGMVVKLTKVTGLTR